MWIALAHVNGHNVMSANAMQKAARRSERTCGLGECSSLRGKSRSMKTPIQLIEQIIRAQTALHLQLVAPRKDGKVDIGGGLIDDLIAEVDAGLSSYERMLVLFKNESAAEVMVASMTDDE